MTLIKLLFRNVLESEARSVLPTVQMDVTWTPEISDRKSDRCARPSECLSSSPGAT